MRSSSDWSTSRVLYLYFCGGLMGAWLTLFVRAVTSGVSIVTPLLGITVALGMTIFPLINRTGGA